MSRCGISIVVIVMCIVTMNEYSFALEEKTINGSIVHDSSNLKLVNNFVEDVVSLLPPEMIQMLEPHLDKLLQEADFKIRDDYWKRKVISQNVFKERLESISIKDDAELASQLGSSVKHIFEIALHPNGNDVMGEGLKKNLKEVPNKWKNEKYVVNYLGYKGQSIDAILATLYEMKKYNKNSLYPNLVTTTADLWSAIWQKGGGNTQLVTKTFVRKPPYFDIKKNAGPSTPPPRR